MRATVANAKKALHQLLAHPRSGLGASELTAPQMTLTSPRAGHDPDAGATSTVTPDETSTTTGAPAPAAPATLSLKKYVEGLSYALQEARRLDVQVGRCDAEVQVVGRSSYWRD
jgi:hypothetical protein